MVTTNIRMEWATAFERSRAQNDERNIVRFAWRDDARQFRMWAELCPRYLGMSIDFSRSGAVARVEMEPGFYLINKMMFGMEADRATDF